MREPLLIVDVQEGFINQYTDHIPQRIEQLLQRKHYEPVLFTKFINSENSPYHRLLDWHDCERPPETDIVGALSGFVCPERVFSKEGLTGVSEELGRYLREHKIQRIALVGIDTDMCVLKVAMDIFDMGIEPLILTDCCASTAGLQAHLAGLAVLSRNIGPHQLRLTGLNEGYVAAPPDQEDPTSTAANR